MLQVGTRVRVIGPQAELFAGEYFTISSEAHPLFTLSNGEEFHRQYLQECPLPEVETHPRTATPVAAIFNRVPVSVWKGLKAAAVNDATVRAGLRKFYSSPTINLNAAQTTNWVAYCVTNGHLTQAQADALLA